MKLFIRIFEFLAAFIVASLAFLLVAMITSVLVEYLNIGILSFAPLVIGGVVFLVAGHRTLRVIWKLNGYDFSSPTLEAHAAAYVG